jgi:NH3-dependent NAD+ synthetase
LDYGKDKADVKWAIYHKRGYLLQCQFPKLVLGVSGGVKD